MNVRGHWDEFSVAIRAPCCQGSGHGSPSLIPSSTLSSTLVRRRHYHHLAELARELGVSVAPSTILRWVVCYALPVREMLATARAVACCYGRPEISVGLIDGPVLLTHPELSSENIREVSWKLRGTCARSDSIACKHGTFVAGILLAKRGSAAPSTSSRLAIPGA